MTSKTPWTLNRVRHALSAGILSSASDADLIKADEAVRNAPLGRFFDGERDVLIAEISREFHARKVS